PHVLDEPGASLSRGCKQIQKQQIDEGSVALGEMTRQANTPALLPSNENLFRQHDLPDVLKAESPIVTNNPEPLRNSRNNLTLRKRPHDGPAPAFIAIGMKKKQ